jgi:hypothetical protein
MHVLTTKHSGLRISGMALPNQSDTGVFGTQKIKLKIQASNKLASLMALGC